MSSSAWFWSLVCPGLLSLALACSQEPLPRAPAKSDPRLQDDNNFTRIRNLLSKPPGNRERALHLYPVIARVCKKEETQTEFAKTAAWSGSFTKEAQILAEDTLEHVATACFREDKNAAYTILKMAQKSFGESYRAEVVMARLLATERRFDEALKLAEAARKKGSIHAIALSANIKAQIARKSGAYRNGMLDEAIGMVSVEPTHKWPLIDLTAVLSSRAKLLSERAIWETGSVQAKTIHAANTAYQRLSVSPFIEATRRHALDNLCFNHLSNVKPEASLSAEGLKSCSRAANESKNLGAAHRAKIPLSRDFDQKRLQQLLGVRSLLSKLKRRSVVLLFVRGDETEVVTWVRPAATILRQLQQKRADVVLVDRTSSPEAGLLLERMLKIAKLRPSLSLRASEEGAFLVPCVTALISERQKPASCPLSQREVSALYQKAKRYRASILVGRDLDAEIDDHTLYDVQPILLSLRLTKHAKLLRAHFKNLADVFVAVD